MPKLCPIDFSAFPTSSKLSTTIQSYSKKRSTIFTKLDYEASSSNRLILVELILFLYFGLFSLKIKMMDSCNMNVCNAHIIKRNKKVDVGSSIAEPL